MSSDVTHQQISRNALSEPKGRFCAYIIQSVSPVDQRGSMLFL